MKIGILTFHSQQNYGGVLQCYAMKSALESLGHNVVVIDRWMDENHSFLKREMNILSPKYWIKKVIKAALGHDDFKLVSRAFRSVRFVRGLGLSSYQFYRWQEAPDRLGVDLLVVGSDQVWHCGDWGNPAPYLLEGAEGRVPRAISYAASFGMKSVPTEFINLYKRGLARFSAISCREKEGVGICRGLGFDATHVVDPTLLANSSCWNKLLGTKYLSLSTRKRQLVCYFLGVDIRAMLPALEKFAAENDCKVKVLVSEWAGSNFPKGKRVRVCTDFGPKEFVRAFASATWTLADSFHAVMFSSIFNKNLRFIKPDSELRKVMFARIEEFASSCINGPAFVDSVQSALDSFAKGETISYNREEIDKRRSASLEWLKKAIGA